MKITKRIISALLCLVLIFAFGFTVTAENTTSITLSNVRAMPGETATIDIKIANNPGIMAMSFCITYDSDAFEYAGYSRGYLSRYTIKDHPDKGHIAFVNDEAGNKSNDGVMLSVKFTVKESAKPGRHTITIANQNREKHGNKLHNSFSNSDLKYIIPTVTAGSITVGETCENAGHKYGEWQIITPADCKNTGEKKRTCVRCNEYSETAEIPITHDFENEWTVDKAATPTEDGIMSRHCKKCNAVTDEFTFSYEDVEDSQNPGGDTSNDDSTSSSEDTSSDVSTEDTTSENESSTNQGSQSTATSKPTSSSNSNSNSTLTNKTPIKNTVGAKNPQSAIENIKDFKENIKPNLEINNTSLDNSSSAQNTDSEDEITSNDSTSSTIGTNDNSNIENESINNNATNRMVNFSTSQLIMVIIGAILSAAIIALAVILLVRRKKENNE